MRSARLGLLIVVAGLAAGCSDDGPSGPAPPPGPEPVEPVPSPPTEMRAVWLSRWDWYDRADLEALVDSVAAANFNAIYLQVRTRSDAYYRSSVEPWAHRPPVFSLGQDPGWDPLDAALERAREHGLEVHAWLNAFIGWCTSEIIPESEPRHILLDHPDWIMLGRTGATMAENCSFLNPAEPGVRARLAAVAADIARAYPVDGVHLDYIRYPDSSFSYDDTSLAAFDAAQESEPDLDFDEFRRRLVTMTVREVGDSLWAVDPARRLSAAAWGVYRNPRGWAGVAAGYETRFQDSRGWADEGLVDAIAPMVYWPIHIAYGAYLDFAYLADEFAAETTGRHVYVGMGVPAPEENFCTGCDVVDQIYRARSAGADGVSVFSARLLRDRRLWQPLRDGPFPAPVPVPDMPWVHARGASP